MQLPAPLRKRKTDTHKGDYGYVLVVGGSPGLTGAVSLCAQAALRIGAGLVRVAVPQTLHSIFEIKLTEVMSMGLADAGGYFCEQAFSQLHPLLEQFDVIALGPGASTHPSTRQFLLKIIERLDKPMVIDADGINALADEKDVLERRKPRQLILTPHPGELSRLLALGVDAIKQKRKSLVKEFARTYNLTLVLKGDKTLVSDGRKVFENTTGNPGMATAGMGDVLTGMIAGLCAQGLDIFEAAKLGVYLHGLAADLAVRTKTQISLIASDVIEYLPNAFKKAQRRVPR